MKTGLNLIIQERERQINDEGYSSLSDSRYQNNELFHAACCYYAAKRERALGNNPFDAPSSWPWDAKYWKPTPNDRVRELVKAGALFKANYDLMADEGSYQFMEMCAKEIDKLLTDKSTIK